MGDDGAKLVAFSFSSRPNLSPLSLKILIKMRGLFTAVLGVALSIPFARALPKVSRTGKFLYDDTGTRFFIKVSLLLHFCP